ncbi:hypothetical protein OIU79_019238 [Salix purpurea]|uniref:Uncharacterized protein n=1 Tax=Salix purpurea TaxID=77065 RepID=A0A9Q0P0S3_SALPP|nr:hypothetical protein OIU79_019238 [Salix purpurea]
MPHRPGVGALEEQMVMGFKVAPQRVHSPCNPSLDRGRLAGDVIRKPKKVVDLRNWFLVPEKLPFAGNCEFT